MTNKNLITKEYWNIVLHSVITFVGQSSMQVVDLMFCRDLGSQASATIGTSSALFAWFLIIGLGITSALEYFIPHSVGEKDEKKAHSYFYSGILVSIIVAIVGGIGLYFLSSLTSTLGFNPEIAASVISYSHITAFSYFAIFLIPVYRVELQTRGFPHDSTYAFLWGNILNVFLNWVFVLGHLGVPAMGTTGSAWASILSRYGILIYLLVRVMKVRKKITIPISYREVEYQPLCRDIFKMGLPSSLQMLFEMGAFVLVSALAARLATSQNAAHTIAITIASFGFMIPLGISSAAAQTVSRAHGEKNREKAIHLGNMSIKLGLGFAVFSSLVYIFATRPMVMLFTSDTDTIRIASSLVMIVMLFQFGDALQVILSGCIRGFGETNFQVKVNAIGHWLIGIPLGMLLCFYFKLDILGLWIGLCTGLWVVALGLLFRWRKTTLTERI